MIIGRIERYTIQQEPEGVVIRMRQRKNALGVTAVALGMLGLIAWAIKPGDFAALKWVLWLFEGFAAMLVVLSVVGVFHQERVLFTKTELCWSNSFRRGPQRVLLGLPTRLRVSIAPKGDAFNRGPVLPSRIDVLLPGGGVGPRFLFETSQHMDQFLRTLGGVLQIEVEDSRAS